MSLIPAPSPTADSAGRVRPIWETLDRRRNPEWFAYDKIGIFIHWSVFTGDWTGISALAHAARNTVIQGLS